MATAVLRPQDCTSPIAFVPADVTYASRFVTQSKPAIGRKSNSVPNTRRRRRSPSDEKRSVKDQTEEVKREAKELVMGKVKILKRGEKLSPDMSEGKTRIDRGRSVKFEKVEAVVLWSTDRLGPDPVVVKEQISVCEKKKEVVVVEEKFAGCVVVASPPPSSLPMPKKFWMKRVTCDDDVSMAMDLRRMLRLDLI